MKANLSHWVLRKLYSSQARRFSKDLNDLEAVQRKRLKKILQGLRETENGLQLPKTDRYEDLAEVLPVSDYEHYRELIDRQKRTLKPVLAMGVQRFEPTIGSTEERKWIPYSSELLSELNRAANAWLGDVYNSYPLIRRGQHYWPLSWMPEELRKQTSKEGSEFFPLYQRIFLNRTRAVSDQVGELKAFEQAWWATLVTLVACPDLTLVSIWNPVFWLQVADDIEDSWDEIKKVFLTGSWGPKDSEIRSVIGAPPVRPGIESLQIRSNDFFKQLWPDLSLISTWDSSSSAEWFQQLRTRFPWVQFQGKGFWTTEGVVTIPFQGQKVLALDSHFYEFIDLETEQILPAWQLQVGRLYQPLLWTSSGLLRYALPDRLKVTGFLKKTPCLEYCGRIRCVDIAGEKMDTAWVESLFEHHPDWKALALVAVHEPVRRYVLFHQSSKTVDIESALSELPEYQVARDLGQLGPAQVIQIHQRLGFMNKTGQNAIAGQGKQEILFEMRNLEAFGFSAGEI